MTKSRITAQSKTHTAACFVVLATAVCGYLYFLNMSVVEVVLRAEYTEKQNELRAEIALLEAEYIKAQHTIVARAAELEGYTVTTDKIFVARDTGSYVVRGN